MSYDDFLAQKTVIKVASGFETKYEVNSMLYDFQIDVLRWALLGGKTALFMDCGLGKTPIQLEWARHVNLYTGGNVLIFAPLAVATQTQREGDKFSIDVNICRSQDNVVDGINITNYEMIHGFDLNNFSGIVLDESSILKNFAGAFRNMLIENTQKIPYKLCCTATPAPNDYTELGNHSEFLEVCTRSEMLSKFFIHDAGSTQKWRLKGHAESEFWQWLCSWAVVIRNPVECGYGQISFDLPPISYHEHIITSETAPSDSLFALPALTLQERRRAKRDTINERTQAAANLINGSDDQWLVWCNLNDESAALTMLLDGAVEVKGTDDREHKVWAFNAFASGEVRKLVTKPSIGGFGMNWQNCHKMVFIGLSDSYEQFYQAIRRCWRFGQEVLVNAHIIIADRETSIRDNIQRKKKETDKMYEHIFIHTAGLVSKSLHGIVSGDDYHAESLSEDGWQMINGDCVVETKALVDESIHFSIFSPPFASLYTYSDSIRDMGNVNNEEQFKLNFDFIASELYRVMIQGRCVALHCTDIPAMKERDGYIGLKDFPALLRESMEQAGFIYHSRITIWKNPVVEVTRTKAIGLLHKQLKKDSTRCRVGLPDYVIVMRKPGENPEPVLHTDEEFSVDAWQLVASPIWNHIHQTKTLNSIKAEKDERHVCPLQIDTIRDLLRLYSNPGDLIFSPFAGIGSEGYVSLKMGRRFIGIELKPEYYTEAISNLRSAAVEAHQELLI
jgi:DNA modification methylase